MATLEQVVEGVVVSYAVRDFESFVDGSGAVVPAGTMRSLWVVSDFSQEPTEIRVSSAEAKLCEALSWGTAVRCTCNVFARKSQLSLRLVGLQFKELEASSRARGSGASA